MPKSKKEKEKIVEKLAEDLNKSKSIVLTDYKGLNVEDIQALRNKVQEADGDFLVTKNTLFRKALEKSGRKDLKIEDLSGPLALGLSFGDETSAAKEIHGFFKEKELPVIKGGILDSDYLSDKETIALAKLPSKDELIAKTVATIKAPVSGFVNVLSGNLRNLVGVLGNIAKAKGE